MVYLKKLIIVLILSFVAWNGGYTKNSYSQKKSGDVSESSQKKSSQKSGGVFARSKKLITFLTALAVVGVGGSAIAYSALKRKPDDENDGGGGPHNPPLDPHVPQKPDTSPEFVGDGEGEKVPQLSSIEKEIKRVTDEKKDKLSLKDKGLETVPSEVRNMTWLTSLDLSKNPLKELPEWIEELENLKELFLSDCAFGSFPEGIKSLKKLESIFFARTKIKKIPEWIGELEKLQMLDFMACDISSLPDTICRLESLQSLVLSGNKIKALPLCIGKLKNLETIRFVECSFDELTREQFEEIVKALETFTQGDDLRINFAHNGINNKERDQMLRDRLKNIRVQI